jgi:hypothetical protein
MLWYSGNRLFVLKHTPDISPSSTVSDADTSTDTHDDDNGHWTSVMF